MLLTPRREVKCDTPGCRTYEWFDLTDNLDGTFHARLVLVNMRVNGWTIRRSRKGPLHFCPECSAAAEAARCVTESHTEAPSELEKFCADPGRRALFEKEAAALDKEEQAARRQQAAQRQYNRLVDDGVWPEPGEEEGK